MTLRNMSTRLERGVERMRSRQTKRDLHAIQNAQAHIDAFVSKWHTELFKLCKSNNQKLACWYLWLRYLLGLRSLRHLCAANDLTGCYTMARCCMEYDVAIAAIANDPTLGDSYIAYDAHAKNRHLRAMSHSAEAWKIDELRQYMSKRYGPDFATKKDSNWHGGFPKLCEVAGREDELPTYHVLCQFVHGTVANMYALNNLGLMGGHKELENALEVLYIYTLQYLRSTKLVVDVLSPLWTQAKQDCESDLDVLANKVLSLRPDEK